MRNPQGYAQIVGPADSVEFKDEYGTVIKDGESDTFTCGHCGKIVHVPPRTDPSSIGGGCRVCDSLICLHCVDKGTCRPLEKWLEDMENRVEKDHHYNDLLGR